MVHLLFFRPKNVFIEGRNRGQSRWSLFVCLAECISPIAIVLCRSETIVAIGRVTYTRQLGTAVTALGGSATLLDVKNAELTTGGLDDSGPVGGGVVAGGEKLLVSNLRTLAQCISPSSLVNSVGKGGISPVTASVGHAVARHFVGWACGLSCRERLAGLANVDLVLSRC